MNIFTMTRLLGIVLEAVNNFSLTALWLYFEFRALNLFFNNYEFLGSGSVGQVLVLVFARKKKKQKQKIQTFIYVHNVGLCKRLRSFCNLNCGLFCFNIF